MEKELKFKKLSEVEKVEEVSGEACVLVEDDGAIKRVSGGIGGDFVFDLTPYLQNCEIYSLEDDYFPDFEEIEEPFIIAFSEIAMCAIVPLSKDEYKLLKEKMKKGTIVIRAESGEGFFGIPADLAINEKFSTQFSNFRGLPDEGIGAKELGILTSFGSGPIGAMLSSDESMGYQMLVMLGFLSGNEEEGGILSVPFSPISLLFSIAN